MHACIHVLHTHIGVHTYVHTYTQVIGGVVFNGTNGPDGIVSTSQPIKWQAATPSSGHRWQLCVNGHSQLSSPLMALTVGTLVLRLLLPLVCLWNWCCGGCSRRPACWALLATAISTACLASDAAVSQ